MRSIYRGLTLGAALAAAALGCEGQDTETTDEVVPGEALPAGTITAALSGNVLDWNDQPVANAEVMLAIGGEQVGEVTYTDAHGGYRIDVPVLAIREAQNARREVNLLFYSPREDRAPHGSVEGDRVHLLPVTLRDFIDLGEIQPGADVAIRTAYVPLQARGYRITPELVADGGALTWTVRDPNTDTNIEVELLIEPGSIQIDGDEPQDEITLTVLDPARAPMRIPNNGWGLMWTLQPRDIRFDPPARLRMTGERLPLLGLTDVKVGTQFELFGATLDRGWKYLGEIGIAGMDEMNVELETPAGVIHRGAWGHVLADANSDAGALFSCHDRASGRKVACALFSRAYRFPHLLENNGVSKTQRDYPNVTAASDNPMVNPAEAGPGVRGVFYSDLETVCGGCTNNGVPHSQMATGLDLDGLTGAPRIWAFQLCESERTQRNIEARDALVWSRLNDGPYALLGVDEPASVEEQAEQLALWQEYLASAPDAPTYGEQDPRIRFGYIASIGTVATCNEGDYQTGW